MSQTTPKEREALTKYKLFQKNTRITAAVSCIKTLRERSKTLLKAVEPKHRSGFFKEENKLVILF